jgi:hypothetical protein
MTNYWKRKFYQAKRQNRKLRKRMKILLVSTISLAAILGILLVIQYLGSQIQSASHMVGFLSIHLSEAVQSFVDAAIKFLTAVFIIFIILLLFFGFFGFIWRTETRSTGSSTGSYGY